MKKLLTFILGVALIGGIHFTQATEYSQELTDAYNRAYENGIITESSIDDANLNNALTNEELANIMVEFSNHLGITYDGVPTQSCFFQNVPSDYESDLCLMYGLRRMDESIVTFDNGNTNATQATLATALSRVLRGDRYNEGTPYYSGHIQALKSAGIINQIDNPNANAIKGYTLLTLMRTSEFYSNHSDCKDPENAVACNLDNQECLYLCKPNAILTNNLKKTVVFPSNEITRRTVFSGTYTALKDNVSIRFFGIEDVDEFMLDEDPDYYTKRCEKNNTDMTFYLSINGEEISDVYVENACEFGNGAGIGSFIDRIILNSGASLNIKVEAEIGGHVEEDDMYNINLILESTGFNVNPKIKEGLTPIKIIANNNDLSIFAPTEGETVFLKGRNSTLAEFTLKPTTGNNTYLNEFVFEIDNPRIEYNDIKIKIDGAEYDFTGSSDGYVYRVTCKPDIVVPSKGAKVTIILKQELEYEDYTIGTTVKSINGKSVNESFSKRFVSVLAYISKQENKGNYTEFTLGVDKYDDNYSIDLVCMLTGSTGAGTCFPGRSQANESYEDGYTFTVENGNATQPINYIDYLIENSDRTGWADNISIEKEDYPVYFKIGSGYRNVFAKSSGTGSSSQYTQELQDAHEWAYKNGLITESNIEEANMFGELSNMELARIMVNYAKNVLNQAPDTSKACNFTDIDSIKGELHDYIIESCQLGIMGQESTTFNPYDTVSRATFGTALSRALWGDKNNGGTPYYTKHLDALNAAGIITQIDNPEDRVEIKGYILLMLMRAEAKSVDCKEPTIALACLDPNNEELYKECPAACRENNSTGTNKCDLNKDGTVNVTDLTINNNVCVNIILNKPTSGTYNCDFNRDGKINVTDVMAYNDECQKEVTGYSGSGSSSNGSSSSSSGKSSGGGGGGGGSVTKTNTTKTSTDTTKTDLLTEKQSDKNENKVEKTNQANTKAKTVTNKTTNYNKGNPSEVLNNGYTREMNNAYQFAHDNGITTTNNIEKAKMNSPLTRIAMAKMLSNYAINVLGKEPDVSKGTVKFNDVTDKQNQNYDNAVTLAYQLGIMGQNMKNNNFRPNDEVTRAEFVTALSRMLYGTQDGQGNTKYYETHLTKLYNEGIITKKDPKIKEKRGYVMLMLMRTAE